jgi:MSHA biogenesis protein MshN
MSLINNMLLNLDARQGHQYSIDEITTGLHPVVQVKLNKRYINIISLVAGCLALMAIGLLYLSSPNSNSSNPASDVVNAPLAGTVIAATPVAAEKIMPSDTPPTHNTQEQPGNFRQTSASDNATVSDTHHDEIPVASTTVSTTKSRDTTLVATATSTTPSAVPATTNTATPAANPDIMSRTEIMQLTTAQDDSTFTVNDTTPEQDDTAAVTLHKTQRLPDAQQRAVHRYASALRYYKQGRLSECINALYDTLKLDPEHIKSREFLGSLLIQQKRWQDAEKVLIAGSELNPTESVFTHLLARMKVQQGDDEQAITLLEKPLQQGSHINAESSALLALLYQRQGQHEAATLHYKQALTAQPNRGKWWLGLAISLEAQQQMNNASKAYRLAASNKLEPQLQEYARQREQAISQQLIAP